MPCPHPGILARLLRRWYADRGPGRSRGGLGAGAGGGQEQGRGGGRLSARAGLVAKRFDAGGLGNVDFSNWWRSTRWSVHACSAPFGSSAFAPAAAVPSQGSSSIG